jgi:cyclopropane fatty-acyl-phospholipid synthase-like methyltransferase
MVNAFPANVRFHHIRGNFTMSYDAAYRADDRYFGEEPEKLLREHLGALDPTREILDVGMGQGRNALWLARRGFQVAGLEPSAVARERTRKLAAGEGLSLRIHSDTFQLFDAAASSFGTLLVLGLIPILSREELDTLRAKVERWLGPSGLLLATAFTTKDPSFARISREWKPAGEGSFLGPGGDRRTFLKPGEIVRLFSPYEVVHHEEVLGEEHRHGEGPLHRHAWAGAVLRRPKAGPVLQA